MNKNCLLCGVGGQGTILASKLIADAALLTGLDARAAETIGMAQRGGSVVSHVRIGSDTHSPMIPHGGADVIMGFEPGEVVRCLPYLKKDGFIVVNSKAVKPVTATLTGDSYDGVDMIEYLKTNIKNLVIIDSDAATKECGSSKVVNVILLGAAARTGMLGVSLEDLEQAILKRLPEKFHELNIKALHLGAAITDKENN